MSRADQPYFDSGHPALAQLAERRSCAEATGPSPVGGHCPEVYRSDLPPVDRECDTIPPSASFDVPPHSIDDWFGLYSIARALKPECLRELTEIAAAYASANAADRETLLGVARMVSK